MVMKSGTTVSNMKKSDLEKIVIEAARIATGTTKIVSTASLYSEIGFRHPSKNAKI